jgi:hypothetical protein
MALDRDKVFEELLKTFEECRESDWGGYGAQPVLDTTCQLAQFLEMLPRGTPVPPVGAEPDGHLTLEWHRSPQWTLSVSIGLNGSYTTLRSWNRSEFAGRKRSGLECHRC